MSHGWVSLTSPPTQQQQHERSISSASLATILSSGTIFQPHRSWIQSRFSQRDKFHHHPHSKRHVSGMKWWLSSASSDSSSNDGETTNSSNGSSSNSNDGATEDGDNGIDLSFDSRLYKVRLSRATGIDWGTDLSFAFVYVRDIDPTGAAAFSGVVSINDQLCEVTPCYESKSEINNDNENTAATMQPINLIGAPFDYVMETFATLDRNIKELDFVFFRGTRDELKSICSGSTSLTGDGSDMITVTVVENKGSSTEMIRQLRAPAGVNVRELLVNNNINVYQSITRWTNCKGKQLCGTCIVNIPTGGRFTNRKSMDESSTLRENPETYRLSCVSFAYGDITVETFPPINAAQWTR